MDKELLLSIDEEYGDFERFHDQCQKMFGARICTVFSWSPGDKDCVRIWSNLPSAYPFPASKPMGPTEWGKAVLYRKQPWEALIFPEIESAFFDHPTIASFECGCCLSAPILEGGEVLGAASILDIEGKYVRGDAERFRELMPKLIEPLKGIRMGLSQSL